MKSTRKGWRIELLELNKTTQFKKDLKRAIKRGLPIHLLDAVILLLREQKPLDPQYRDHDLIGDYKGFRECHIQSDWLLIYRVDNENLILVATRTGTHSDLF